MTAVLFMAALPVVIALILLAVVFGGRLKAETRSRIEGTGVALLYPAVILAFLWQAFQAHQDANAWRLAGALVAAVLFTAIGLHAVHRRWKAERGG